MLFYEGIPTLYTPVVMKRTLYTSACTLLALAALLTTGCNLSSMREHFDKEEGKEVLARAKFDRVLIDSTGELQVYASMNRSDELRNKDAILSFADPYKELYLLVFKEDATDVMLTIAQNDTLSRLFHRDTSALLSVYGYMTIGASRRHLTGGSDSLLTARRLNGMDYQGYAVTGSYKHIPLFYLKGIYRSKHYFYQVVVWTLGSRRNLYEGIMQKMAESLREEEDVSSQ